MTLGVQSVPSNVLAWVCLIMLQGVMPMLYKWSTI